MTRTVGPATQRALSKITADPFTQVAILRVFHNARTALTPETRKALADAEALDALPLLETTP